MLWRFEIIKDSNIDIYIIRDIDSHLNKRERNAVDEWIQSEKKFSRFKRPSFSL